MNYAHRETNRRPSTPSGLTWLRGLGNSLIDLLFPPRCVTCQRLGAWLCSQCIDELEIIDAPLCPRCGLPADGSEVPGRSRAACRRCEQAPLQLDGLRAYAFHTGFLRRAIHQFKYEDLQALAGPLGKLMADGWARLVPPDVEIDTVVPIPLHRTRQRERGYNQASLLARQLAARLHRPLVEDALVRVRATAPQIGLSASERQANVHNAFRCPDDRLRGQRVLLVDDVCTTGSTLEAASTALRHGGATSVWAYTLARARA